MSILVSILLIVNIVTYTILKQVMEHQFGLAAQSVAVTASLMISEDLDAYRYFLATRDVESEYYQRMQNYFAEIKRTSNIRIIYTVNKLDDTRVEFILDSEPVGSSDYSAPGDIEEMTPASREVFLTKQPAILGPTGSAFGVLLGGKAPILDEYGSLLGAVAVSIDNSMIYPAIRQLFIVLGIICILLLVFIFFFLSKISHFFLEPMLKDKLTGAYNKRYFDSFLQESIDTALKTSQDLSVMMIDLDHFKLINDTYGHVFGDVVLSKVSTIIRDCLRKDDFVVRYGGEEFVVLLFNIDSVIAMMLAERIRKMIESCEIYNDDGSICAQITISIGISNLQKRRITALEMVNDADKALYKAKETRNTVAVLS
jgi:diguanylate cyclase (GGDEF)-like protein